jgi:hypothetical protein
MSGEFASSLADRVSAHLAEDIAGSTTHARKRGRYPLEIVMVRPSGGAAAAADNHASPGARGSRIALAGLVFSALFVLAWTLLRESPSLDTTAEALVAYYGDPDQRRDSMIAGLYVIPFAGIAFIWFMAALHDRAVRTATRENTIMSTAHVVAGALVVTSLFTLAAVELAVVWLAEIGDVIASGLFPHSYGALSLLTALALLLVYESVPWVTLLFPAWVAASSVLILVRRHSVLAVEGE